MILVNDLGDGFPTFPQFQVMLREYEADLIRQYHEAVAAEKEARAVYVRSMGGDLETGQIGSGWSVCPHGVPSYYPCRQCDPVRLHSPDPLPHTTNDSTHPKGD